MGTTVQVLRQLPGMTHPNLLVGADHLDDAAVYKLDDSTALVTTLDFFPPLVDDPYTFGRIAATNSLSDIYAMGGKPLTALNIVGFPDNDLPAEILCEILRGGAERVTAAGAVVAGGHSVRDSEIKYGLSVTGVVHPDRIMTNGGALLGDVLILTKPIGSGILTSAAKTGKISESELAEAIDVMIDLNAGACDAILELAAGAGGDPKAAGIHAVTDITGFGLIGHAHEMAEASDVSIELQADKVPLLENALRLARDGIVTRAHKSNLEHLGDRFHAEGVDETLVKVLADAQTSGGLLIAVATDRADLLVSALKRNKTRAVAAIGRAVRRSQRTVLLR
jgi:selenide,water dikinase